MSRAIKQELILLRKIETKQRKIILIIFQIVTTTIF